MQRGLDIHTPYVLSKTQDFFFSTTTVALSCFFFFPSSFSIGYQYPLYTVLSLETKPKLFSCSQL